MCLLVFIFSIFGTIIAVSAGDLVDNIPFYEDQLVNKFGLFYQQFSQYGIDLQRINIQEFINPASAFQYLSVGVKQVGNVFAQSLLILIIVAFILLEAAHIYCKADGKSSHQNLKKIMAFINKVNQYMAIKTVISFATGLLVTIFLMIMDIHYPVLWGLLAFILNFVPNVGSIIASVPAFLLAIIQYNFSIGFVVLLAYLVINFVIGNIIEPNYMGDQLGVMPLIIILSLIFWGWIFGAVGMLLAVPLTIIVKFGLESAESTRWVANLMEGSK